MVLLAWRSDRAYARRITIEVAQELDVPRLQGVFHTWAFYVSLAVGAVLVSVAPAVRGTLGAAVYAASIAALFGVSALYTGEVVESRPAGAGCTASTTR